MAEPRPATAVCLDFGSTWTKALHVDLASGAVIGTASHPTSLTEVMDSYDACLDDLGRQDSRAETAEVHACSSAGGGLRIAVVGNEELVTAEAGRRVALSSGGKVAAVVAMAGRDDDPATLERALTGSDPDLVLLTGGTDGGNSAVLLGSARVLAGIAERGLWRGPVVVAGNTAAAEEVAGILSGLPHVLTDNVVPRIGVLAPEGARAAVREMFLEHVIGGKELSQRSAFLEIVRGATPDVVLTGVEVLAGQLTASEESDAPGGVVVVDVGGATTDVHSVVPPDAEEAGLATEVVAVTPVTRTVEGDLGMRWSAVTTVEAAGLADDLGEAARRRRDEPGLLPESDAEWTDEETIARSAVDLALRRHAGRSRVVVGPDGRVLERTGVDLREVSLVLGSGGVLRHGRNGIAGRVLAWETTGGWQLPETGRSRTAVDVDYRLAAVGLLADPHPQTARRLAAPLIASSP